ncbi:hypothetical protein SAMN05661080_04992 [Modestobacter sp. DSM 44400]|uniref:hypothetical protein n=1 Tax=Modestobacter sp. DSM 44400 TaxID=1550230 RepID=UPI00089CAA72|nr:hypothetical protein [Modestobacter sp. DSM 44400]SDY91235.1 hypothetical protein SAMN05661080_04992 [Modestobacter sp. DSM 44400]
MTTDPSPAARSSRSRTMHNDLLQDLRQAAPPAVRPPVEDRPPRPPRLTPPQTPAAELRFTPRRWSNPALRRLPGGDGLVLHLGPLQLTVGHLSS